CMQGIQFPVTF
nr:immunoglobulin light chain junction region [Macaca mulatta]